MCVSCLIFFFFSSRRRHTRYWRDWSSDVCSSDLQPFRIGRQRECHGARAGDREDRKSTRLNSSHANISYAVFCLKKKKRKQTKLLKQKKKNKSKHPKLKNTT